MPAIPSTSTSTSTRGPALALLTAAMAGVLGVACRAPEPRQDPAAAATSAEATGTEAVVKTAPSPFGERAPFLDATAETGLDFVHWNGRSGGFYYSEMMGSGGALVDVDLDGDLDLFLVQGAPLGDREPAVELPAHGLGDRLYRNDLEITADGERRVRFVDITREAGLEDVERGYGMGAAAGDFDGDGYPDLYITRAGRNQMLRHRGGATPIFDDVTDEVTGIGRWSVPAVPLDADGDGDLDLFVANYVAYSLASDKQCTDELGQRNYCGPLSYPSLPDNLLINVGAGPGGAARFMEAGGPAGLDSAYGAGLGAVALDIDLDGRLDLYVANDGDSNQLWHNQTTEPDRPVFREVALVVGAAVSGLGQAEASMGVALGDADRDGDEDLLLTHLARETHTLYAREDPPGVLANFIDRSTPSGLGAASFDRTGFGTGFLDVDHDGHLDLVAVAGAVKVIKALALRGDPYPLHQPNQLFRGLGDGRFEVHGAGADKPFGRSEVSRGAIFGDLDNDGDVDLVITNNDGPARVLINAIGQDGPWFGLRLLDAAGREAPGALVELRTAAGEVVLRRVGGNASYASSSDPRVHFSGPLEAREVRVLWPGGGGSWERFQPPPPSSYAELRQGEGGGSPEQSESSGTRSGE
ncbi:MAG: CRTAC1 family protein [Acidobacteriota bacterium]